MARSLAEIDADIAEVQKRIAKRNEGMPSYGDPGYRAARFDYIVEGDRSGLDAYQNALNAAIQNKLSRESSEKMAKAGKAQASLEEDDEIVKNLSNSDAVVSDLKNRNYADDSVEMRKALNERDYWITRAKRKGLDVAVYQDAPKAAPVVTPAATAAPQSAPKGRTHEAIAADIARLADNKDITLDQVNALEQELMANASTVPYDKMTESVNLVNAKKKAIGDSAWNEYNSRVKAALGEKDYAKRKAALEPLKEELGNYKGQEKYAEVEKSINDGLKKPAKDPLTKGVVRQHFSKNDIISLKSEIDKSKDKGITKNIPVGGRNRTLTFKTDKDGNVLVLNEKGREVDRFTKAELAEFDTANKVTVEPKQADIPIVKALKGESKFPNGRIIVGPGEDW